jgi:hypothetical protein
MLDDVEHLGREIVARDGLGLELQLGLDRHGQRGLQVRNQFAVPDRVPFHRISLDPVSTILFLIGSTGGGASFGWGDGRSILTA